MIARQQLDERRVQVSQRLMRLATGDEDLGGREAGDLFCAFAERLAAIVELGDGKFAGGDVGVGERGLPASTTSATR